MSKTDTDWRELADLAVRRIRGADAEYGDIRLLDSVSEIVRGQDRRIAGVQDSQDSGFGVRVLYRGAWGFEALSEIEEWFEQFEPVLPIPAEVAA